ncbi:MULTISPECIES: Flp pilus assembly protein CpaB [unclassified Alcaligenes]|uniref:Flp pilus assembly protein CpaB n=1 Tax=unclassified Alcaligenes TaxID=259357 RepID=UPI00265A699C|nr:Flp pilus assembly protein CpaB [Alcaligenes faecalis]HRK84352.1 Flp pilus assembly protein CpaB [Alcaligenes faecalis]
MSGMMKGAAVLLLLVAAVLVAVALYLGMQPNPEVVQPVVGTHSAEPAATLYPVVVAKRDVKAGEALQADALELAQWPAAPAQSFDTLESLTGKTLRFDLGQGQPVLSSFIAKSLASYLDAGERAVTIPVDVISGASNRVEPGDLVDIFMTFNNGNEVKDTQARLLMPRVRVLAYGSASLSGPDPAENTSGNRADTQVRHAMLAVPLESVNELLLASRSGSLQVVLRAPKDESLPDPSLFPEFAGLIPARTGLDAEQREALKLPDNRAMAGLGLREFTISQSEKEQVQARAQASGQPNAAPPRRTEVIRGGRLELIQH